MLRKTGILKLTLPLLGAAFAFAAGALPAYAQIGSGWTEYFPTKSYNGGVSQSQRYTNSGGVEHFWIYSTDPSAFPGEDSGPRSEWRVNNNYTTGSQQFQAYFNVDSGTNNCTVFQIFGSTTQATSIQLQMRAGNGTMRRYNSETITTGCYGVYKKLNVLHYTSTGKIEVWINGSKIGTFNDGGNINHYFKYGVYATPSVSSKAGILYKSVRYFKK